MADTYIDLFETQTYGKLACIEMRNRVLPLGAHWVTAVQRCIDEQERVNALMEAVLARMGLPKVNPDEVAKVADTIVRFGSWIDSLAGRPIDPFQFFGNQVPSAIGRERLSKLTGHLDRMVLRLTPYAEKPPEERIDGVVGRLAELKQAYDIAVRNRDAQREALQARKELSPEAARARQEWLRIYTANKFLIEGVLRPPRSPKTVPSLPWRCPQRSKAPSSLTWRGLDRCERRQGSRKTFSAVESALQAQKEVSSSVENAVQAHRWRSRAPKAPSRLPETARERRKRRRGSRITLPSVESAGEAARSRFRPLKMRSIDQSRSPRALPSRRSAKVDLAERCGGRRSARVDLRERCGRIDPRETTSSSAADASDGVETDSPAAASAIDRLEPAPPRTANGFRRARRSSTAPREAFGPAGAVGPRDASAPVDY